MTRELREEIKDYHDFHGDKGIKIMRIVSEKGSEGISDCALVRIGYISVLDLIHPYVTELTHCEREHEDEMIRLFENGKIY